MRLKDIVLSTSIILLFLLSYCVIFLAIGLEKVKKNWNKYKCNPSVMPFASQFGYDGVKNFVECVGSTQINLMSKFTDPIYSMLNQISNLGGNILNSMNSVREMINWVRFSTVGILQDIISIFVNLIARFQIFIISIKTLIMRLIGVSILLMYKVQTSIDLMDSAWKGPPGDILRFIAGE